MSIVLFESIVLGSHQSVSSQDCTYIERIICQFNGLWETQQNFITVVAAVGYRQTACQQTDGALDRHWWTVDTSYGLITETDLSRGFSA